MIDSDKDIIIDPEKFEWKIPDCCKEGWENCPHVVNRPKRPQKQNIAL
jgi:hypothetical protein